MTSKQHKDWEHEQQRLEFTKRYMDVVIKTSETSKHQFMKNMQEAFGHDDWLLSGGYSELLSTAGYYDISNAELESLQRARPKPYFARVDFTRSDTNLSEVLYFGKTSLYQRENQEQLIVDWRSPISNLYYEGRIGQVAYEAEGESFAGEITLKRQLMIEDGNLDEIRDIDLTTTDDLLQDSLSKSSSNRLTEIVSTIQEEQNKIIRADLNKPMIVQGAAGSGKTTIALHRISYFIYFYKEQFDPRQLMILAPSRLFIDYISDALPELGVEKAKQFTFSEYVLFALGQKVPLAEDRKLVDLLEKNNAETAEAIWVSGVKGSKMMKMILDNYVKEIFTRFYPKKDFYCDKYRLYSARKFKKLLEEEYQYLPLYSRIEKLKSVLTNQVKAKKQIMFDRVTEYYDNKIEKALNKNINHDIRREFVTHCLDKKAQRQAEVNKAVRSAVRDYVKEFEKKDLFTYYQELFLDADLLVRYSTGMLNKEEAIRICSYHDKLFQSKQYEVEDLGSLLYLHTHLFGVDKEKRAKNIVIDEAQDYSFMQLLALKTACETDMFTLVGDLAQGIHSYRGLESWHEVHHEIFPRATYAELQKSYRTTVEIMMEANKILKLLPYEFPQVEPVVRHGEQPIFLKKEASWVENMMGKIEQIKTEGFRTFAIICKTMDDCRSAYDAISSEYESVCLLEEQTTIPKDHLVILPSYLAKGLEFDVVFALSLNETYNRERELDLKLLYVVMTRPLHRLYFIGDHQQDFLQS